MLLLTMLALATGMFLLGVTAAGLMAWTEGSESRLPFDHGDDASMRLAKAGLDVTWGTLPIVVGFALLVLAPRAPSPVAAATVGWSAAAGIGYVVVYLRYVRPRMARYRLARRARALARPTGTG